MCAFLLSHISHSTSSRVCLYTWLPFLPLVCACLLRPIIPPPPHPLNYCLPFPPPAVVFAHCRELNEVILSPRLPAVVRSRKFWRLAFGRALYAQSYEEMKKVDGEEARKMSVLTEGRSVAGETPHSARNKGTRCMEGMFVVRACGAGGVTNEGTTAAILLV